jgi:hypothetical protein
MGIFSSRQAMKEREAERSINESVIRHNKDIIADNNPLRDAYFL